MPEDDYSLGETVSWIDKCTENTTYGVIDIAYPPNEDGDGMYHVRHEGWFLGFELRRDVPPISDLY